MQTGDPVRQLHGEVRQRERVGRQEDEKLEYQLQPGLHALLGRREGGLLLRLELFVIYKIQRLLVPP